MNLTLTAQEAELVWAILDEHYAEPLEELAKIVSGNFSLDTGSTNSTPRTSSTPER